MLDAKNERLPNDRMYFPLTYSSRILPADILQQGVKTRPNNANDACSVVLIDNLELMPSQKQTPTTAGLT